MDNKVSSELQAIHFNIVSSHQGKNDKLAWKRKVKKMEGLISDISHYEEEILKIVMAKQPIMDDINKLRIEMVRDCIHPKDHLVHHGTYITCKFCERNISIPRIPQTAVESSDDE